MAYKKYVKKSTQKPQLSGKMASAIEGIKTAIQTEIDGYNFYFLAAQRTKNEKGKEMFQYLAEEELRHREILEAQNKSLMEEGKWGKIPKPTKVPKSFRAKSPIFSPEFSKRGKVQNFEMSALSIGILLEQRSIEFFSSLVKETEDPQAKMIFKALAKWEGEHLRTLTHQHNLLQREYWADARFEPLY